MSIIVKLVQPSFSFTTLIVLFLFSVYFLILKTSKHSKLLKNVPGPKGIPLLNNAWDLMGPNEDFLPTLLKWCRNYGTRYTIRLARQTYVVLTNAEDVEKILSSQDILDKSKDYDFLHPWLATGLLTSTGQKWFHRRKMLTSGFHFKILEEFLVVFNEQSKAFVSILKEKFQDTDKVFDIFPYITRCALDIICESAMGKQVNAQRNTDSEYVSAIYRISDIIQYRQVRPWLRPDFIWSRCAAGKEEKKLLKILHGFTDSVIQERKADRKKNGSNKLNKPDDSEKDDDIFMNKKKRLAFMDILLEAQEKEGADNFTDADIREETDTFMFEGHDTTAANANWTTFLIGCHPQYQAMVHKEMDEIFGDDRNRPITMEDISKMKYLEACVKEGLRLYPSVPIIGRTVTKEISLDKKTTVPPGTTIIVIPFKLHRDPKVFSNPEEFDPNRFLNETGPKRNPYSYVPFSAGPRNCIGQKFATMEEKVLLANFFRNFEVEAAEERDAIVLMAELILRPRDGLKVKIKSRPH